MHILLAFALAAASAELPAGSPCSAALESYAQRSSVDLVDGYFSCIGEGRIDDAAFLDLLVRIRASSDMLLFEPLDPMSLLEDPRFQAVYARGRAYIDETLARDPQRFDALLERVRDADLSVSADYHPGWEAKISTKRALYEEVVIGMREDTLALERYVATLVRDEVYFAAYLERVAMLEAIEENGSSSLPERFGELSAVMSQRQAVLGEPPQGSAVPWREIYEPKSDALFTMLHRGFNGTKGSGNELFRDAETLSESWVGRAIGANKMTEILAAVNFDSEVVAVFAVGEMRSASRNVFVTEFGQEEDFEGYSIRVTVGVVADECGFEPGSSYPFVVVKAPSSGEGQITSSFRQNYPDRCEGIMAGDPVAE